MAAAVASRVQAVPYPQHVQSPVGTPQVDEFFQETRRLITACVAAAMQGDGTLEEASGLSDYQRRIVQAVSDQVKTSREFFETTCDKLELTPTNTSSMLMEVFAGIFKDGVINSGRIIATLCFCQHVTVYCRLKGLPSITEGVPHWAAVFISTSPKLRQWLIAQGGWKGLQLPKETSSAGIKVGWMQFFRGLALTISVFDALQVR